MTFKTNCVIAKGPLDPVPMVNVVFLLLIFFVLSSPLVIISGIRVIEMPIITNPSISSLQGLVVTISRDNAIFFNNQLITPADLRTELRKIVRQSLHSTLVIKADRQVSNGAVYDLYNIAIDAGITDINLAGRPEMPTPTSK